MRTSLFSWIVLSVGITLNTAHASNPPEETPLKLEGGFIVSAEEAQVLIDQGDIYLADCRSPFNYGKGHLPGAHSLEYQLNYHLDDLTAASGEKRINFSTLPENKKTILIFYSHGTTGWKSYRAAKAAIAGGYTQVHWLRGGIQAWQAAGYELEL